MASSLEELRLVRLFRAYQTALELCLDRGYTVRHPASVRKVLEAHTRTGETVQNLTYEWFAKEFVTHGAVGSGDGPEVGGPLVLRNKMTLTCRKVSGKPGTHTAHPAMATAPGARAESSDDDDEEEGGDGGNGAGEGATAVTKREMGKLSSSATESGKETYDLLLVFFAGGPTGNVALTIPTVQEYRQYALKQQAKSAATAAGALSMIVLSAHRVLPVLRRDVQEMSGRLHVETGLSLMNVELFEEEALVFNPTRHGLVPVHQALAFGDEEEAFLRTHQLERSHLPRMSVNDPIARYFGFPRGCIVRIERPAADSSAEQYLMYRQVI